MQIQTRAKDSRLMSATVTDAVSAGDIIVADNTAKRYKLKDGYPLYIAPSYESIPVTIGNASAANGGSQAQMKNGDFLYYIAANVLYCMNLKTRATPASATLATGYAAAYVNFARVVKVSDSIGVLCTIRNDAVTVIVQAFDLASLQLLGAPVTVPLLSTSTAGTALVACKSGGNAAVAIASYDTGSTLTVTLFTVTAAGCQLVGSRQFAGANTAVSPRLFASPAGDRLMMFWGPGSQQTVSWMNTDSMLSQAQINTNLSGPFAAVIDNTRPATVIQMPNGNVTLIGWTANSSAVVVHTVLWTGGIMIGNYNFPSNLPATVGGGRAFIYNDKLYVVSVAPAGTPAWGSAFIDEYTLEGSQLLPTAAARTTYVGVIPTGLATYPANTLGIAMAAVDEYGFLHVIATFVDQQGTTKTCAIKFDMNGKKLLIAGNALAQTHPLACETQGFAAFGVVFYFYNAVVVSLASYALAPIGIAMNNAAKDATVELLRSGQIASPIPYHKNYPGTYSGSTYTWAGIKTVASIVIGADGKVKVTP